MNERRDNLSEILKLTSEDVDEAMTAIDKAIDNIQLFISEQEPVTKLSLETALAALDTMRWIKSKHYMEDAEIYISMILYEFTLYSKRGIDE